MLERAVFLVFILLFVGLFAPISFGGSQGETYDSFGEDCGRTPKDYDHYTPSGGGDPLEPVNDNV